MATININMLVLTDTNKKTPKPWKQYLFQKKAFEVLILQRLLHTVNFLEAYRLNEVEDMHVVLSTRDKERRSHPLHGYGTETEDQNCKWINLNI